MESAGSNGAQPTGRPRDRRDPAFHLNRTQRLVAVPATSGPPRFLTHHHLTMGHLGFQPRGDVEGIADQVGIVGADDHFCRCSPRHATPGLPRGCWPPLRQVDGSALVPPPRPRVVGVIRTGSRERPRPLANPSPMYFVTRLGGVERSGPAEWVLPQQLRRWFLASTFSSNVVEPARSANSNGDRSSGRGRGRRLHRATSDPPQDLQNRAVALCGCSTACASAFHRTAAAFTEAGVRLVQCLACGADHVSPAQRQGVMVPDGGDGSPATSRATSRLAIVRRLDTTGADHGVGKAPRGGQPTVAVRASAA